MYSDQTFLSHEPFLDESVDSSNRSYQIKKMMHIGAILCLLLFLLLLTLGFALILTKKQQQLSTVSITDFTTFSENIATALSDTTSYEFRKRRIPNIPENATWSQTGVTIGGGYGSFAQVLVGGYELGSLVEAASFPMSLAIDDEDQSIFIADESANRILHWRSNNMWVVAGGNGIGDRLDQLKHPSDVLVDKETNSLIICDKDNKRVVQWSLRRGTKEGELLIDNIGCIGLAMDDQRYLYVVDSGESAVRRYKIGNRNGTVVAGGNGQGNGVDQFNGLNYIFVDQNYSIYVSDNGNNRVMKWNKDGTEGVIVAGNRRRWGALGTLYGPNGLFVDTLGTVYVVEQSVHRVTRWPQDAKQRTVIVGGYGGGIDADQLHYPTGLSFDWRGNLYVADRANQRVQCFSIK